MIPTDATPHLHSQVHIAVLFPVVTRADAIPFNSMRMLVSITDFYSTLLYHLSNQSLPFVFIYTYFFLFCLPEEMCFPFPNEGVFNEPPSQRPQPQPLVFLSLTSLISPLLVFPLLSL